MNSTDTHMLCRSMHDVSDMATLYKQLMLKYKANMGTALSSPFCLILFSVIRHFQCGIIEHKHILETSDL